MKKGFSFLFLIILLLQYSCYEKPQEGTWEQIGLEGINVYRLVKSSSYLYACTGYKGLWKKDLNSINSEWEYLGMADSTLDHVSRGVREVVINPENSDEILIVFNQPNTSKHQLYKTIDGGANWVSADSSLCYTEAGYVVYPPVRALVLHPNYIIAAGSGTYMSDDFGNNWSNKSISPQFWVESCILEQNKRATNHIWLGGHTPIDSPVLASSSDGGYTWRYYDPSEYGFAGNFLSSVLSITFNPEDSNTVYVSVGRKIIKTTNNGDNWVTISDSSFNRVIISDPIDENHMWSVGSIFKESLDEGVTWKEIETPILTNKWEMIFDEESQSLYFGTENGVYSYALDR